jgi:hypothetical protein
MPSPIAHPDMSFGRAAVWEYQQLYVGVTNTRDRRLVRAGRRLAGRHHRQHVARDAARGRSGRLGDGRRRACDRRANAGIVSA